MGRLEVESFVGMMILARVLREKGLPLALRDRIKLGGYLQSKSMVWGFSEKSIIMADMSRWESQSHDGVLRDSGVAYSIGGVTRTRL
jgi:hypothetical protein